MNTPWAKSLLLFFVTLAVISTTFAFAILHHDDGSSRIRYSLVDHNGQRVTQNNFAGRHQLVFFGFTRCAAVCPTQTDKITRVMQALEKTGHAHRITPMFISVDPERDSPQDLQEYLAYFHKDFVGLTGSRFALKTAADSFKTLLAEAPANPEAGYQITHSSVVYVVDPFSRVIDFISFDQQVDGMTERVRKLL